MTFSFCCFCFLFFGGGRGLTGLSWLAQRNPPGPRVVIGFSHYVVRRRLLSELKPGLEILRHNAAAEVQSQPFGDYPVSIPLMQRFLKSQSIRASCDAFKELSPAELRACFPAARLYTI